MDYDFSGIAADQLLKLEKRLSSLNKSFIKEFKFALNVINNPVANEKRNETMIDVDDLLRDASAKCQIQYTEALNKVTRELRKWL